MRNRSWLWDIFQHFMKRPVIHFDSSSKRYSCWTCSSECVCRPVTDRKSPVAARAVATLRHCDHLPEIRVQRGRAKANPNNVVKYPSWIPGRCDVFAIKSTGQSMRRACNYAAPHPSGTWKRSQLIVPTCAGFAPALLPCCLAGIFIQ